MPYHPKNPESGRRSIRLPDYDYAQPGAYFITIVARDRAYLFGEVVDGEMVLSSFGKVVESFWNRIPDHFIDVETDAFMVMPNHVHGVLQIMENDDKELHTKQMEHVSPQRQSGPPAGSIGAVVGNFKSVTTRRINKMRHTPGTSVWQRNYYDRIVRNERELNAIRQYILDNPRNWMEDRER